jgi:hypothetical protein
MSLLSRAVHMSAAEAIRAVLVPSFARASGALGEHVLTDPMIADDPFVADEATLPPFLAGAAEPGGAGFRSFDARFRD